MNASSGMRDFIIFLSTAGMSTALPNPCDVCVASPTGYCSACTVAVPAAEKAIPAVRLASAMSSLPCLLEGSDTAVGNDRAINWIACFARASETGFFPTKIAWGERPSGTRAQKDSMAWLSASIPEWEVTWGGHDTVKEGSTIAHLGMIRRV